jgi:hypothetical protein
LIWTAARDAELLRLRTREGKTWDEVSAALGVSRYTAIERGRILGNTRKVLTPDAEARAKARAQIAERTRPPYAAGHPFTWGLLIAGTPIVGAPYPHPVFL